ncbi:hypothetical protein B484DRAFT_404495 [Ochromonadaceae sp. CCMP2298]|nr:hypothetical protein B484DRAFT_404495 [Ochromonadaceae sp. CCMP2298]
MKGATLPSSPLVYLDHAGATLPCTEMMTPICAELLHSSLANPHSSGSLSDRSAALERAARITILAHFRADPAQYDVIFTSGSTAALRLVGEAFPWDCGDPETQPEPQAQTETQEQTKAHPTPSDVTASPSPGSRNLDNSPLVSPLSPSRPPTPAPTPASVSTPAPRPTPVLAYPMNAHTSLLGMRAFAQRAACFPSKALWHEGRGQGTEQGMGQGQGQGSRFNLLLVPGECNFSGAKADLRWVGEFLGNQGTGPQGLGQDMEEVMEHEGRGQRQSMGQEQGGQQGMDMSTGKGMGSSVLDGLGARWVGEVQGGQGQGMGQEEQKGQGAEAGDAGRAKTQPPSQPQSPPPSQPQSQPQPQSPPLPLRWLWLLDAAKLAATSPLHLSSLPPLQRPHFVVASFYKMFGYPTGLGVLLLRRDVAPLLRCRYFGGGTLQAAAADAFFQVRRKQPHQQWEQGTPNYYAVAALRHCFRFLQVRLAAYCIYKCTI